MLHRGLKWDPASWAGSSPAHSIPKGLNSITPMGSYLSPVFFELRDRLITFLLFVRWQQLIARSDHELFSSNRGVSHVNKACCINELSRWSVLGYEILTF
jgi:hypothetical protein